MRVVEVCPAPEASRIEEGVQAEGGILKAHIIFKKGPLEEGRLVEGAAGEADRPECGIVEVDLAGKGGFLEAGVVKGCAPEGGILGEAATTGGGVTRVPVQFRYGTEAAWQDVVVLVREGSGYVIDDIEFSGAGPFNPPGRLSEALDRAGE